jgi:hypothetical protein
MADRIAIRIESPPIVEYTGGFVEHHPAGQEAAVVVQMGGDDEMSITIEMDPEMEVKLREEAGKRGLEPVEYVRLLLERLLLPSEAEAEEAARLAAVDAALGALASVPFSSDDLAREKQMEIDREENRHRERFS